MRISLIAKYRFRFLRTAQTWIEKGAPFFAPLSWGWGFFSFWKNRLYDKRILPIHSVPCTVVSIGNIVAGGTGKTPLVHLLAKQFLSRKVAILIRGYGVIADEALLLARRLPFLKVYVGKDRAAAARKALGDGMELLILDDGFQHRRLHRDFDLVILRGGDPFGKGHYLPWGFLRDSPKRLSGVDAIFAQGVCSALLNTPHITLEPTVTRILDFQEKEIETIFEWQVGVFCGIGNPESFKKTIRDLGGKVVDTWILADHAPADTKALQKFSLHCKSLGAKALVCTEKDFVKLSVNTSLSLPILFLEIELRIAEGHLLWQKLIEKIDQRIDNTCQYDR
ncbi:MAG: tetraacyldisaccharide 4'-kinase [Chlamydiota bacterium]